MAHMLGGAALPLVASPVSNGSVGAPWLPILLDGLRLSIEKLCGNAWASVAPAEPICRTIIPRDPERYHFKSDWLPALFLWVDRTSPAVTERISAGVSVRTRELNLLWLPHPALWTNSEEWLSFWTAIDGAIDMAVNQDFSPWTTADAWGQKLVDAASLMKLTLGSGGEQVVQIKGVNAPVFEGYEWKLTAQISVTFDPLAPSTLTLPTPIVPNKLSADIAGGDDGSWILQSRLPKTEALWT